MIAGEKKNSVHFHLSLHKRIADVNRTSPANVALCPGQLEHFFQEEKKQNLVIWAFWPFFQIPRVFPSVLPRFCRIRAKLPDWAFEQVHPR